MPQPEIITGEIVATRSVANESEQRETFRRAKDGYLRLEKAWRWAVRLSPLVLIPFTYAFPDLAARLALRAVTIYQGIPFRVALAYTAWAERSILKTLLRAAVYGAATRYARAVAEQTAECRVYREAHPGIVTYGWRSFWKAATERTKAQAAWDAKRRRHVEEVEMLRRDFPGLDPEAVIRLRDQVRQEATNSALGKMRNAEPPRPAMTDVSVDGKHVSDIAREIAQSCTAAVADLKAFGLSHRSAMRVSSTLREVKFVLYGAESRRPVSYEPVAYMDAHNGRLVTLNPRLVDLGADVRAQVVESVLLRNMLHQNAAGLPTVYGTPTEHGEPYEAKAAPRAVARR